MHKYFQGTEKELLVPKNVVSPRAAVLPFGNRLLPALLIASLVALGIAYLIELNFVSAKGFALRSLESKLAEAKDRQKKLQVELAQKESLTGLSEEIEQLGMVPVHQAEYVRATTAVVAVK